jgi:hypothetical protein
MIGSPEEGGRCAQVMRNQRDLPCRAETNLVYECAELFGEGSRIVAFDAGGLIRISEAAHVRHEHRESASARTVMTLRHA